MRSSDHPPATLQCEQLRLPVMLRWLVGFGTILPVLAMLILHTASRCQVLFPLTARPACTQPRLTARCAPCAVGACLPLPFNHHTTRATWLGSATTCSRAGACPVHHVHRGVCGTLPRAPPMMTGGGSTSTPCCVALWLSYIDLVPVWGGLGGLRTALKCRHCSKVNIIYHTTRGTTLLRQTKIHIQT